MRRATVAALAFALVAATAPASFSAVPALVVNLDQGTRISLGRPARDIVVANPEIADVTLLDSRNLIVLGKAAGTTSLLVVDSLGRTLIDRQVIVSTPDEGRLSFYRGAVGVQDFACSPLCAQVGEREGGAPRAAP